MPIIGYIGDMNFSLYIAKRYLRSKSSNNAINFISIIAIVGVVLAAAALFIVLSGFAGLKAYTLEFSTDIDPDLKAETVIGKSFILTEDTENKLKNIEGIASYSKIIEERALASFDDNTHPSFLKGVDDYFPAVNKIDSILSEGAWMIPRTKQIVMGWGISNNLSIGVLDYGKRVKLYVPRPGKGQISSTKQAFKQINVQNVGIFEVNENLNNNYIFTTIEVARDLLSYQPNQITDIEFKLSKNAKEESIKSQIQSILGNKIVVKNREELNESLHKMLNIENLFVYLVFTLVLIIALFNVIGSIIMMILDKKQTLNTLFNLGATVKDIRRIFFLQGTLMTIIGGVLGLLIGALIIFIQQTFEPVMITPNLPYPVVLKIENLILVFITITVFGVIASKIASVRINRDLVKTG